MSRVSLLGLAAAIILGGLAWAGDGGTKESKCCAAAEKISKLLASWKAATEASKTVCADEKAKVEAELASIAKGCPIGSRMGETIAFVKSALASAVAADEACAKDCPLSKAGATTAANTAKGGEATAAPACEAGQLKAARTQLLASLNELAGFAAGTAPASGACSKGATATTASARPGACCAEKGACCAEKGAVTTSAAAPAPAPAFCEKRAGELISAVRKEACDKGAAALLMKEVDGLKCEKKAGEIVASIRAESCDEGAAKILIKAAGELKAAACAKEGTACAKQGAGNAGAVATSATAPAAAAPAPAFCEKKAGELISAVRKEACDKGAAALLMKEVDGLKCEKKAGEIVASIRAESCDEGAAKILIKAAGELKAAACAKEGTACAKQGAGNAGAVATSASAASVASAKSEACAKEGVACCKDLSARATVLKASWEKAPQELTGMCPQKKKELMASLGSLGQRSKVAALLPETVMALADGVDALEAINTKIGEWAKANPDALKDVPEEVKKTFAGQNAVIHEAGEVLRRVRAAVKASSGECTEKKTETASNS